MGETVVMGEHDTWMAEHKGDYLYSCGMVWECGDDWCGCTEAQVLDYFQSKKFANAQIPVLAWSGEFHTDHEGGADVELAAYRRHLRELDPEREAAIRWQEGVDYGDLSDAGGRVEP